MKVGIDVLCTELRGFLKDKRVGLLSHQAATTATGATSAQLLRQMPGVRLQALFGPEHGFLGQAAAGAHTSTRRHPDWDIPVYSLYDEGRRPTAEMLQDIDVVVCDLQDLGVRCYTYLATLRNMLEACSKANIDVIVADRPIPLPNVVDGPMAELGHLSFVAPCTMPFLTGMTPAESALWMHQQLGLKNHLAVAQMHEWQRADAVWDVRRPDFVSPSPGIKGWESAMCYAATVFTEALLGIDCGRHTNMAFRVLGAPWLRAEEFCAKLAEESLPGVSFHPYRYEAGKGAYNGTQLDSIRLSVTDAQAFRPTQTSVVLLRRLAECYGVERVWEHPGSKPGWFDTLYGTQRVREYLLSGAPLEPLFDEWRVGSRDFLAARDKILLYR